MEVIKKHSVGLVTTGGTGWENIKNVKLESYVYGTLNS